MATWTSERVSVEIHEWVCRKHGLCPWCGDDLDLGCGCSDREPYQPTVVDPADDLGRA